MEKEAERILKAAAAMYDVTCQIKRTGGAAGADNSPEFAEYLQQTAETLGIFNPLAGACPFGASEDYSYFMEKVPGVFGFLGSYDEKSGCIYSNHNDRYDVVEDALKRGAAMHAQFAADYLAAKAPRE